MTHIRNIGIVEQVRLWNGCMSYWKLDETSGLSAADTINGKTLTLGSDVVFKAAKQNNGAEVITAGKRLTSTDAVFNFTRTDSWSYSTWFKRTTSGNIVRPLMTRRSESGGQFGYALIINSNNTIYIEMIATNTANWTQLNSSGTTPTDTTTFHHFVWTYNGGSNCASHNVYLDSVSMGMTCVAQTLSGHITSTGTNLEIGGYMNTYPSKGIHDEVAIWNRVLSPTEVKMLYSAGNGKFYGTR